VCCFSGGQNPHLNSGFWFWYKEAVMPKKTLTAAGPKKLEFDHASKNPYTSLGNDSYIYDGWSESGTVWVLSWKVTEHAVRHTRLICTSHIRLQTMPWSVNPTLSL
jgi:hypothetical protein